jgi:hypothetical protein
VAIGSLAATEDAQHSTQHNVKQLKYNNTPESLASASCCLGPAPYKHSNFNGQCHRLPCNKSCLPLLHGQHVRAQWVCSCVESGLIWLKTTSGNRRRVLRRQCVKQLCDLAANSSTGL